MPTSKKPSHTIVWNRGKIDRNGLYRAGVVTLNFQDKGTDGKPAPLLVPLFPGLHRVEAKHYERAEAEAKGSKGPSRIGKMMKSGRLRAVKLEDMSHEEGREALDQTMSKAMLNDIAEGKHGAPAWMAEHAQELKRTWGKKDQGQVRKITKHFASFSRERRA